MTLVERIHTDFICVNPFHQCHPCSMALQGQHLLGNYNVFTYTRPGRRIYRGILGIFSTIRKQLQCHPAFGMLNRRPERLYGA